MDEPLTEEENKKELEKLEAEYQKTKEKHKEEKQDEGLRKRPNIRAQKL